MEQEKKLQLDLDGDGEFEINITWRLLAKLMTGLTAVATTLISFFRP